MKSTVKCDWCSKEITSRDRHGQRNKHHYCSKECGFEAKAKKLTVECDWCGEQLIKKRSDVNRNSHNFCDRGCYMDYINFEKAGAKNQKVSGRVLYRLIAESKIGRVLTSGDEVHHIDGDHLNNDTKNLLVVSRSEHMRIHAMQKKRDDYGRFIRQK